MAMIKCKECGKEISDKADKCPNCGFPIQGVVATAQSKTESNKAEKTSGLSITALVFSILGCTFVIGAILAIIDLCKKDERKKTCSIIALVICGIWLIICVASSGNTETKSSDLTQKTNSENIQSNNTSEETIEEEQWDIETSNEEKTEQIKDDIDSIKESVSDIWNDAEVTEARENWEKSIVGENIEENGSEKEPEITIEEIKNQALELNYKDVMRNPDNYVGQYFYVTVKISSVENGSIFSSYDKAYKSYTNDQYDLWFGDMIYLLDNRNEESEEYIKILKDDIIVAYGRFDNLVETKNVLNGSKSEEMSLQLLYVELVSE